jgi:hypothetical protein
MMSTAQHQELIHQERNIVLVRLGAAPATPHHVAVVVKPCQARSRSSPRSSALTAVGILITEQLPQHRGERTKVVAASTGDRSQHPRWDELHRKRPQRRPDDQAVDAVAVQNFDQAAKVVRGPGQAVASASGSGDASLARFASTSASHTITASRESSPPPAARRRRAV